MRQLPISSSAQRICTGPVNAISLEVRFSLAGAFSFSMEDEDLNQSMVRQLVWNEILHYHNPSPMKPATQLAWEMR